MPSYDTPEPISARIDLGLGDVRISAGERTDTIVTVEPNDASSAEDREAAELTRVEYANGQLVVKAPKQLRSWLPRRTGGSISVTIGLPAGSDVRASAGVADIHADGPLGECVIKIGVGRIQVEEAQTLTVKSGAGDLSVDRVTGHAEVSISGDVRVRELDSSAVIKKSSGDTWVGMAAGDLKISGASGDIAVDLAQSTVIAKTATGDVRLGEIVRGSAVLETHLGDVEVGIREGTAAWLDVRASAGSVHNALDAADAPEASGETVEVRARTSAGDVVVRRPEEGR